MSSGGLSGTAIPIVGTLGTAVLDRSASRSERLKGLDLSVALPDLRIPGLPSTMRITNPMFAITADAPDALEQPEGAAAPSGPFVTIGAGLTMRAGSATHEFDALLIAGRDADGKTAVNLFGSAKDPKGLFTFKGLRVKSLDLASVYEASAWDFRLDGTADLNAAAIEFEIEVQRQDGEVSYVATLSGGERGIMAGDIAGRHVPGLDKIALTNVTVTSDRLVADFAFGAKKTAGEIAAFHVGSGKAPVLAMTLDRLAFGELLPGAGGLRPRRRRCGRSDARCSCPPRRTG